MAFEGITDEKIESLINRPKWVKNAKARKKSTNGSERLDYEIEDEDGHEYVLFYRQNSAIGMNDDFSCGLRWIAPGGNSLMLLRYNGPSHDHPNVLEGSSTGLQPHIHKATERYIDAGRSPEGYAEATQIYKTVSGALHAIVKDANIKGLETEADLMNQTSLF